MKVEVGVYQRLLNSEVQESLQGEHIVKAVKTQRLQRYGYIKRMEEEKAVKKVLGKQIFIR